MCRANSYSKTEEKPKKMKFQFSAQKLCAFAMLMFTKGIFVGIMWLIAHTITVPNDRIPHTDPGFVRFLGAISLGEISIGASIFLIFIMLHLWEVMRGRETL